MRSARHVSLSADQCQYLATSTYLNAPLRDWVSEAVVGTDGGAEFDIDPQLAEEFRSALTERLATVGFDEDYELNEEGERLEGLLDAFNG